MREKTHRIPSVDENLFKEYTVEYAVLAMSHDMLSRNRVAKSAKVVGKVFTIVPTSTHF